MGEIRVCGLASTTMDVRIWLNCWLSDTRSAWDFQFRRARLNFINKDTNFTTFIFWRRYQSWLMLDVLVVLLAFCRIPRARCPETAANRLHLLELVKAHPHRNRMDMDRHQGMGWPLDEWNKPQTCECANSPRCIKEHRCNTQWLDCYFCYSGLFFCCYCWINC